MSLKSKFSNIKHSIKYKSFQPYKFFILKKRFKKNREITLSMLEGDLSVIRIEKDLLEKKFVKEYSEFKKINDRVIEKFKKVSNHKKFSLHGIKYPFLLYIIIKIINPSKVLETGVWLGLSTNSILSSGVKNCKNFSLDSIDLPRADIKDSESYIGFLIDKKLKKYWKLYIGKDRAIAKMLIKKNKYNLYHFDSDKSLNGKLFLLKKVLKNSKDYFIIFDDLEDNLFWYRNELRLLNKTALKYGEKYVGLIYSDQYISKIKKIYE